MREKQGRRKEQAEEPAKEKTISPMHYAERALLRSLIVVTLIYLLLNCVIGIMRAPNDDMTPSIYGRDLLLYYRLDKEVKAGDVIVLGKNDTTYIGRVIAVGGDTVEITDEESVRVNGNTLAESRIYSGTPRYEGFVEYPLTLAQDECFVLVDRRNGGEDSRYYGPVSREEIKGIIITIMRRNNI